MSVLSDIDFVKKINKRDIVIIPYNSKLVTGLGYDLTIGVIVDMDDTDIPQCIDGKYILKSKHRYVVITNEYVWLSRKYMATLHARGSLSLMGLSLTSTTVDPNFMGYMPMCITNLSDKDVELKKDEAFITIVIHELNTSTDKKLGVSDDGTLRIAERKISELFDENDCRKNHLFEYLTINQQKYRNEIDEYISKANSLNRVNSFITGLWKDIPDTFKKLISFVYYIFIFFVFIIFLLCIWTLAVDNSIMNKVFPNFSKDNAVLVTAIISISTIIINKHKK